MKKPNITPGPWKTFNGTDVFTNRHEKGKGDILICDCFVHEEVFDYDNKLSFSMAKANANAISKLPHILKLLIISHKEIMKNNINPYLQQDIMELFDELDMLNDH